MRYLPALLALALLACGKEPDEVDTDALVPVKIVGTHDYGAGGFGVFLQGPKTKVVPIIIGLFEAQALLRALEKKDFPRPVSYDLLLAVLERSGGEVRRLVIHSLVENVFHAYLVIEAKGESFSLDCRPSDGMVLVTRLGAPIYMTRELIKQTKTNLKGVKKVRFELGDHCNNTSLRVSIRCPERSRYRYTPEARARPRSSRPSQCSA